jgi:hypothetical protein
MISYDDVRALYYDSPPAALKAKLKNRRITSIGNYDKSLIG